MSGYAQVGFNAQKVGVKEEELKRGKALDEEGGACVTMQGPFGRVCVHALELPARETRFDSPDELFLSNNAKAFQRSFSKNVRSAESVWICYH